MQQARAEDAGTRRTISGTGGCEQLLTAGLDPLRFARQSLQAGDRLADSQERPVERCRTAGCDQLSDGANRYPGGASNLAHREDFSLSRHP